MFVVQQKWLQKGPVLTIITIFKTMLNIAEIFFIKKTYNA
jgi:hypothetical protein